MKDKGVWVVEFRLAFEIRNARDALDAAWKGKESLKRNMGLDIGVEYARVFEYETDDQMVGPVNEYFANPSGTKFRAIDQNFEEHKEMINARKDNPSGPDSEENNETGSKDSGDGEERDAV